jgi:hypothetical protein
MSSIIKDVLTIKKIERIIGRKLDDLELEAVYLGEPIYFQKQNGQLMSFVVQLYLLPHDLMNIELDMAAILAKSDPTNFFDYAFSAVQIKAVGNG